MASAIGLMDMDISKMSDIDFRVAIMKSISRLQKNISHNIESLRAEMRSNQAEIKNAMDEKLSKLDTLTARVNDAEEWISELEDKMIERKEAKEAWDKQLETHENRLRSMMPCNIPVSELLGSLGGGED